MTWTEPLEILLVEDDEQQAGFIRELLEAAPLSIIHSTWAGQYDTALHLLRSELFDAALVDYHLGTRNGLQLVRDARRSGCDIPYIILTADADRAIDAAALEEGVADFLHTNELTPEALDRALRYAIRHHRALTLLRQREEHFRALIQNLSDAILLWDAAGTIRFASESFARLFGVAPAAVVGRNAFESVHPDDVPLLRRRFEECLAEPRSRTVAECRFRYVDGSWRDQEVVAVNRLDDPSVRAIVVTFHDITERKRAECELRRRVDQLNAIISHIPMSVWAVDAAGVVTFAEGQVLQRFGTAPEALQERTLVDAWSHHPDLVASTRRALAGEEVHDTIRVDGGVYEIWYSPRRDDGMLTGAIGVAVEVTDRVRLEEELRQSQKIEAIGRLAGGVAHDFNNLLTAIIGYTDLALERASSKDTAERLTAIQRAANTAAGLTRQLLAFSRRQLLQPKPLDLNVVITQIEPLLRRLIGEDITLVTSLERDLPSVNADPHQIEQIVMNLAVNARDAMPHGGRLTLATRQVRIDADFVASHRGAKEGPHVLLSVTDTGEGMSPEVRDRLFEPFFTTKEYGRGTGLGLATVYGIVKQSDGYIWVTSEVGQGTTFDIYLPVSPEHADVSMPAPTPPVAPGGTETILVVDDQPEVRSISCEILRRYGYRVLQAAGPAEALSLVSAPDAPAIDLLFTDVVMPEMSGRELARRLQALRPNLRVIYTSGYSNVGIGERHVVTSGIALLVKPFTAQALVSKVREVLSAETRPLV
jgi:two-component system cell cycle sensor histidine kinase/response regulator CckA